jgi:hypothetical protein
MDKEVKGKKKVGAYKAQIQVDEINGDEETLVDELKALVSSVSKRLNRDKGHKGRDVEKGAKKTYVNHECIAKGCSEETTFPLCKLHYHSLVSGKTQSLELQSEWGFVTYDESSKQMNYPPKVPEDLGPTSKGKPRLE